MAQTDLESDKSAKPHFRNLEFVRPSTCPELEVFIEGYILPRLSVYDEYEEIRNENLVGSLFEKYGYDFISYVKGIFILIVRSKDNIKIYNDRHSIKKIFYWEDKDNFVISNSLDSLNTLVKAQPAYESLALYCLMEHFICGYTAFMNVFHCLPASVIDISNKIEIKQYWNPSELFSPEKYRAPFQGSIDKFWNYLIYCYINHFDVKEASITLTGGNDSRMVLAALLHNGIDIKAFTFGDPESIDCSIASRIADETEIDLSIYSQESFNEHVYSELTDSIYEFGNSLINLHRAHRLDAVNRFAREFPVPEMLFTGLMGGEYLKGIQYDDYIIPKFLRIYEENGRKDAHRMIMQTLAESGIATSNLSINKLTEVVEGLTFFEEANKKRREFLYAYYIYASAHHYQDSTIFMRNFPLLVNPFMDIDFLEQMASMGKLSFQNKPERVFEKLFRAKLQVEVTHKLAPQMSHIPYAKKGLYSANELLGNPLIFFLLRMMRMKLSRDYPPNFVYRSWFQSMCESELKKSHEIIRILFNIEELMQEMESDKGFKAEGYWHHFTNPINLSRIFHKYGQI